MKIALPSLICMCFIITIDAMHGSVNPQWLNEHQIRYSPPPLKPEHFDIIQPGCQIVIRIHRNKYEERGVLHNGLDSNDVRLYAHDITPANQGIQASKCYSADLNTHYLKKPVGQTLGTIQCGKKYLYIIFGYDPMDYNNRPTTIHMQIQVGNKNKETKTAFGYIQKDPPPQLNYAPWVQPEEE